MRQDIEARLSSTSVFEKVKRWYALGVLSCVAIAILAAAVLTIHKTRSARTVEFRITNHSPSDVRFAVEATDENLSQLAGTLDSGATIARGTTLRQSAPASVIITVGGQTFAAELGALLDDDGPHRIYINVQERSAEVRHIANDFDRTMQMKRKE